MVHIQSHFHAGFELFLREQSGAQQHERHQAGFLPYAQATVGKQFINADNGAVAVKAQALHDGESFVAKDTLAHLQADERNLGIHAADIIRTADAHVRFVVFHGHQERADTKGGRAEFLDDFVELLKRFAGLVVHLLHRGDAVAQIDEVHEGRMVRRQFSGDEVNDLERGKFLHFLVR